MQHQTEWVDDCDNGFLCVPHDASKWDQWLQSRLMIPPSSVPDDRIKNTFYAMVENGYIKISKIQVFHCTTG